MYDIIFLSYNEAKADENWETLKARFPRAQRVHGVKGIVSAHQAAAAKCDTKWFWVVDADNVVDPNFDFTFKWPIHQNPLAVAVWRARNNVNDLVYGYGGIKLLPRRRVLDMDPSVVDFTTSIGDQFNVIDVVASTTVINSTPFEAWKSGFREAAKLASSTIHRSNSAENERRLQIWCEYAKGDHADQVLRGANAGREYGLATLGDPFLLVKLNDFNWLHDQFLESTSAAHASVSTATIIRGLEELYPEKPFIKSLRQTLLEYPNARWEDALSHGQVASKHWLVDKLIDALWDPRGNPEARIPFPGFKDPEDYLKKVYLCGSWYGTLADMMLDRIGSGRIGQIRGLDLDPQAVEIANRLLKHWDEGWKFKSSVRDIHDLTFTDDVLIFNRGTGEAVERIDTPSMIVNTSCEHIENFDQWYDKIPRGRFVVMQSNDFFEWHEHVNCSKDLAAFTKQTPMKRVLFSGELPLEKYTRFMRIGIR
jgi:hypothetical protein